MSRGKFIVQFFDCLMSGSVGRHQHQGQPFSSPSDHAAGFKTPPDSTASKKTLKTWKPCLCNLAMPLGNIRYRSEAVFNIILCPRQVIEVIKGCLKITSLREQSANLHLSKGPSSLDTLVRRSAAQNTNGVVPLREMASRPWVTI